MTSALPTFNIHPADLVRRRQRCRPVVEQLAQYEITRMEECNICGSPRRAILANQDRYGFPARTALCLHCGLIYVVDRFTPNGYAQFYNDGCYRDLISGFKGKKQTIERIDKAQIAYTQTLLTSLSGLIPSGSGARLLDIGGSTGLVANEFRKQFDLQATLLEPSPAEAAAARKLGLNAVVGSLEQFYSEEPFDVILLCRTVEHLFDLKVALTRIHNLLKPHGVFYCDIAEFMEICRREGPPEACCKSDHTFWLTQETARGIFASLGFEIVSSYLTLPPDQLGFLLRKSVPEPAPELPAAVLDPMLRAFRQINTDWQRYGTQAEDGLDWLKQRAYALKKRFAP